MTCTSLTNQRAHYIFLNQSEVETNIGGSLHCACFFPSENGCKISRFYWLIECVSELVEKMEF